MTARLETVAEREGIDLSSEVLDNFALFRYISSEIVKLCFYHPVTITLPDLTVVFFLFALYLSREKVADALLFASSGDLRKAINFMQSGCRLYGPWLTMLSPQCLPPADLHSVSVATCN